MNTRAPLEPLTFSIAGVERDTGLAKDTLRVWERRYGFPQPGRDAFGERAYGLQDVEKLRVIKRLLDQGLELLFAFAQSGFSHFALRDVLDCGEETFDGPIRTADGVNINYGIDDRAVSADEALVHRITVDLAGQHAAELGQVGCQILRICELRPGHADQFIP